MTTNLEKFRKDLERLILLGEELLIDFAKEKNNDKLKEDKKYISHKFLSSYQKWYSESFEVVKQLLPSRIAEFEELYRGDKKKKEYDLKYAIQDWLLGVRSAVNDYTGKKYYGDYEIVFMKFQMQMEILKSVKSKFDSTLFEIRQIIQADFFDSEVEVSNELLKYGFYRAGGAVSGVVLEKHLKQVCQNHNIGIQKKNPTIADYNDTLKNEKVLDVPVWRFIQRLADLRNLCVHDKEREPAPGEVKELIDGVAKAMKTIF